jgi:hypothetical protein
LQRALSQLLRQALRNVRTSCASGMARDRSENLCNIFFSYSLGHWVTSRSCAKSTIAQYITDIAQ